MVVLVVEGGRMVIWRLAGDWLGEVEEWGWSTCIRDAIGMVV